jgi:hypothetical protein
VLRIVVVAVVIALIVASWLWDGGPQGRSALFSGLISLGIGVSLLLMPVPEQPAPTPGTRRRRGNWGEWFDQQDRQREFHWNWIAGWVLVVVGAVYLLLVAL